VLSTISSQVTNPGCATPCTWLWHYSLQAVILRSTDNRQRQGQRPLRSSALKGQTETGTTHLNWLNDETGAQVCGIDDGEGLKQTGSGATSLVPVATEHTKGQDVPDEADHTHGADDVDVNEQLVLRVVAMTLIVARRRHRTAAVCRHAWRHIEPRGWWRHRRVKSSRPVTVSRWTYKMHNAEVSAVSSVCIVATLWLDRSVCICALVWPSMNMHGRSLYMHLYFARSRQPEQTNKQTKIA